MEVLNVEFYPSDKIYASVFDFAEKDSYSPQFESMGYESSVFIEGLGSEFINICLICMTTITSLVLTKLAISKYQSKSCRKRGVKLHQ